MGHARDRMSGERGNILIVVVFIATAIAGLAALSAGQSGKRVAVTYGGSKELLRAALPKLRTVPFRTVEELEAAMESD